MPPRSDTGHNTSESLEYTEDEKAAYLEYESYRRKGQNYEDHMSSKAIKLLKQYWAKQSRIWRKKNKKTKDPTAASKSRERNKYNITGPNFTTEELAAKRKYAESLKPNSTVVMTDEDRKWLNSYVARGRYRKRYGEQRKRHRTSTFPTHGGISSARPGPAAAVPPPFDPNAMLAIDAAIGPTAQQGLPDNEASVARVAGALAIDAAIGPPPQQDPSANKVPIPPGIYNLVFKADAVKDPLKAAAARAQGVQLVQVQAQARAQAQQAQAQARAQAQQAQAQAQVIAPRPIAPAPAPAPAPRPKRARGSGFNQQRGDHGLKRPRHQSQP